MSFNGSKQRLSGQYNFSDFFVLLQSYYDKVKGTQLLEESILEQFGHDQEQMRAVFDDRLYGQITYGLFRLLVDDLFEWDDLTSRKRQAPAGLRPVIASHEML